jgi:hypothetical protein
LEFKEIIGAFLELPGMNIQKIIDLKRAENTRSRSFGLEDVERISILAVLKLRK